jgi:hypothetical protein
VITVTVTAEDGATTKEYVVTVTRAAAATPTATATPGGPTATPTATATPGGPTATPTATATPGSPTATPTATATPAALTLTALWPNTGLPEGGMPVALLGSGFVLVTEVRVDGTAVDTFTVTSAERIDFTMPAGTNGTVVTITVQTEAGSRDLPDAFRYEALASTSGGVLTPTNGVTLTIPGQGGSGVFHWTYVPNTPPSPPPGSLLFHSFELSGTLDGAPLTILTNPITIEMMVNSVPAGEQPWLYEWTADGESTTVGGRRSAIGGQWSVAPTQTYDPVAGRVTARVVRMGRYVVISGVLTRWWFPQIWRIGAEAGMR